MKRTLIKQGKGGITVTLPVDYIRTHNLEPGDEIDICEEEGKIIIEPIDIKKKEKTQITINVTTLVESAIRTIITNCYRAGYDIITIKYVDLGQFEIINKVVSENLLGFEIMENNNLVCKIEEIAEPNVDDYNNMFIKILQMTSTLFDSAIEYVEFKKGDIKQSAEIIRKIQKYDNFCRRATSKKRFVEKKAIFYWTFFTLVVHAARKIYFMQKELIDHEITPKKEVIEYIKDAREVFEVLKKAYLKKEISILDEIQEKEKQLIYKKGFELLTTIKGNNNILIYQAIDIIRNIYLSTSPLYGILID